ncbi:hypothetical protein LX36DRAFT_466149 [Colletotrichum falcatum]|nr:hypothetical protein LX36DRAFT_466149 [Colletotrichum falcatum]
MVMYDRRLESVPYCGLAGTWLESRAASRQHPCHEIDPERRPCSFHDGQATVMLDGLDLCYGRVVCGGFGQKAVTYRGEGRAVCYLAVCRLPEVGGGEATEICVSVSLLDQLYLGLCAHRLVCGRLSWRHVEGGCSGRTPSLQPIRFEFLGASTLPAEVLPITRRFSLGDKRNMQLSRRRKCCWATHAERGGGGASPRRRGEKKKQKGIREIVGAKACS